MKLNQVFLTTLLMTPTILIGQSLESMLPGDPRCTGSTQSDPQWGLAINNTVQVGQKIVCTILPDQAGEYAISIIGFEPLTTLVAGQRVFNITINGEVRNGIDFVKMAGGSRIEYEISFRVAAQSHIIITFESTVRTAVWSRIGILKMNPWALVKVASTQSNPLATLPNNVQYLFKSPNTGIPNNVIIQGTQVKLLDKVLTLDDFPQTRPDDILIISYWRQ